MAAQIGNQSLIQKKRKPDLSEETPELFRKSEFTDITLVVKGKELNFAKYPLTVGSTVLASMIKGSEDQSRLVLDDVSYKDMIMFLECLHPLKLQAISDRNLEAVAELAHRFKHDGILQKCEEYIVHELKNASGRDEMYSFFLHLKVADKCEMKEAVQVGVSSASVVKAKYSSFDGYGNKDSFRQLSTDTKNQILSRRLSCAEEEIQTLKYENTDLKHKITTLQKKLSNERFN